MAVSHCLDYCKFIVSFEIWKHKSFDFILLYQDYFDFLSALHFHLNFRINLQISRKYPVEILIGGVLNIEMYLDRIGILTILSFLIYEH